MRLRNPAAFATGFREIKGVELMIEFIIDLISEIIWGITHSDDDEKGADHGFKSFTKIIFVLLLVFFAVMCVIISCS